MQSKNLTYTEFIHEIKKVYNINVDDLPVYQIGIIKYFYKLFKKGNNKIKTLDDYIKEVIKKWQKTK